MNSYLRIAKKIERISNELLDLKNITFTKLLNDCLEDITEIGEEISSIATLKNAKIEDDNLILDAYSASGELISSIERIISKSLYSMKTIENQRTLQKIRDNLLKSISTLDSFYKTKLNPKFNFHGITHKILNDRLNQLKKSWKQIFDLTKL